jgi:hypothetical protein
MANVEDPDDIRMIERRGDASLVHESRDALRIGGLGLGEQLDGDVAAKARVGRAIHVAHSAPRDEADHLIRPDHRARRQLRVITHDVTSREQNGRRFKKAAKPAAF